MKDYTDIKEYALKMTIVSFDLSPAGVVVVEDYDIMLNQTNIKVTRLF